MGCGRAPERGHIAVQQFFPVELGLIRYGVHLGGEFVDLALDMPPVLTGENIVCPLDGQLSHPLQKGSYLLYPSLRGLKEGYAVLGILGRPVQSPYLGAHLLRDGQA
ncbi:hypothetical protein SDC9_42085 [bioreactor metagenome]|uniref:Uncharacterized protein n=1 Tax=bioreactor metagenome TaxID=1076179 RepID=A0A644VZM3_9ZZZZ